MDSIAEYLLRLVVTLTAFILAVDLVCVGFVALRGLFERRHHHHHAPRPSTA